MFNSVTGQDESPMSDDIGGVQGIFGPAYNPIGLPADNQSSTPPPGFETTVGSVQPAPPISTIDKIWDTIKQDSQSAIAWTEDEVKAGYSNTKNAVGTVVGDVTSPIASAAKSFYWYAILGVVVIAAGLYFVGKGGAVKVNAIV